MNKLIAAGWYRVRKNWVFWFLGAIVVYLGIYCGISLRQGDWDICLEIVFPMAIVTVTMAILNVATEYSTHAMRNKLSTGHTKSHIFFAELLLNVEITCVYLSVMIVWVAVIACGTLQRMEGISTLEFLVMLFLTYTELTIIVTVTGLLFASGIQGGIVSLVVLFAVPLWICKQIQMYFINVTTYQVDVEEMAFQVRSTMTHLDVNKDTAEIWQMMFDILIGGQCNNTILCVTAFLTMGTFEGIFGFDENMPIRQIGYSLLVSAVFVIVGYFAFRKKDMK